MKVTGGSGEGATPLGDLGLHPSTSSYLPVTWNKCVTQFSYL